MFSKLKDNKGNQAILKFFKYFGHKLLSMFTKYTCGLSVSYIKNKNKRKAYKEWSVFLFDHYVGDYEKL